MINVSELAWAVVLAGGGGAAVSFGAIRLFGEKWLESRFASRLEQMRHSHEQHMERLRFESSHSLDRATRLSEREFEVTAEAWRLVVEANTNTLRALPGFRSHSDFSRLSDKLARIAAEQAGMQEWEVDELLESEPANRNRYYNERRALREMAEAKQAIGRANGHLARNALFIDRKIYDDLNEFLNLAWMAITTWEIVHETKHQGGGPKDLEGLIRNDEEFRKNSDARIIELEKSVRSRFWPELASRSG